MDITELLNGVQYLDDLREDVPRSFDVPKEELFKSKELTENGLLVVPPAFDFNNEG